MKIFTSLKLSILEVFFEENPLSDIQLNELFENLRIYDVDSKHDYLLVDERTRRYLQEILKIRKSKKSTIKSINIS